MKKLITLSMLACSTLLVNKVQAQAPQHEWTSTYHITTANTTAHEMYCMTSDRYDNVYAFGYADDTITFNNGTLTLNVAIPGNEEYFIAKFDKNGQALWIKTFQSEPYFYTAATDSAGNLFLGGRFSGTIDIDPGTGTVNVTSTGTGTDGLIVKFDSSGDYAAHRTIPSSGWVQTKALTVDHQGNVITSGTVQGGCYMAKFDNSLATNLWNDSYQGGAIIMSISCDVAGNMYIAGELTNSYIDFGSVGPIQNYVSNTALFMGKINAAGVEQWGRRIPSANIYFRMPKIAATGNGVFISGYIPNPSFAETINFDYLMGSTAGEVTISATTNYIVEYNEDGDFLNVMSLPSYNSPVYLDRDLFGNVYASGMMYGQNIDVDPGTGTYGISSDLAQPVVYLIKLDSAFGFVGAGTFGYYTDYNQNKMSVSPWGTIYHNSIFQNTLDFDFSTGVANTTATTDADGFLVKTTLCNVQGGFSNQVNVSNGTATAAQTGALYQWLDCDNNNAPIAGASSQTYAPTVAGNYSVVITMSGCHDTSACTSVVPVSVESITAMGNATFYPNPATDIVTIENAEKGTLVTLADVTGKVLYSGTVSHSKHQVNVSAFTPGLYILTTKTTTSTYANKLLIHQ